MNKFILISVCALVALASAQHELDHPAGDFEAGLDAFRSENICDSRVCFDECSRNRNGNPALESDCKKMCDYGCKCETNCRSDCQANNPCPTREGLNQALVGVLCNGRVDTCVIACKAGCEAKLSYEFFKESFKTDIPMFRFDDGERREKEEEEERNPFY